MWVCNAVHLHKIASFVGLKALTHILGTSHIDYCNSCCVAWTSAYLQELQSDGMATLKSRLRKEIWEYLSHFLFHWSSTFFIHLAQHNNNKKDVNLWFFLLQIDLVVLWEYISHVMQHVYKLMIFKCLLPCILSSCLLSFGLQT